MKLKPDEIYDQATRRGLRLIARGDKLEVIPKSRLTPDFTDVLREHKAELLEFLETCDHNLTLNCASWRHVAKQILAGEFDGCDSLTRERLTIGLRNVPKSKVRVALARLEGKARS